MRSLEFQWTKDSIHVAILKYLEDRQQMPTAKDFDSCEYLPSARYVQRNFGGLVKLREELGLEGTHNFTTGEYRSKVAGMLYAQSRDYEEAFYGYLLRQFEEIAIHEQKRLRPGNIACDFFIYSTEHTGVALDLFYAESLDNTNKVVNIKYKRYLTLTDIPIFFVLMNESITQEEIDRRMSNRKHQLPANIRVLGVSYLKERINELIPSIYIRQ